MQPFGKNARSIEFVCVSDWNADEASLKPWRVLHGSTLSALALPGAELVGGIFT